MDNAIFSHLNDRLCAHQWRDTLTAFAHELSQDLTAHRLRQIMRRTGERFASTNVMLQANTIDELCRSANQLWRMLDWGWMDCSDADDHLALTHYCSPLAAAFGTEHLGWSSGFLEGVYEVWMRQLGADESLRMTQQHVSVDDSTIVFRFGR